VYYRQSPTNFTANGALGSEADSHAVKVAGVMISTDTVARGVAVDADLFSVGINEQPTSLEDVYDQIAQSMNFLATLPGQDIKAINISFGAQSDGNADGSSTFTSYIDWSAKAHDILYVVAGNETGGRPMGAVPDDNFNGLTVVFSKQNGLVYCQVDGDNVFTGDDFGVRTYPDIMAPGRDLELATSNNAVITPPDANSNGTSFAAPHVTGTIALLHQYGNSQSWGSNAHRHEVMKAVIMNSADKLEDNGTFAPHGYLLGMQKTALKVDGSNWLTSTAYLDGVTDNGGFIPLDDEMGAGHLNAQRAYQQYSAGETDPDGGANVPAVGWDYHTTGGVGFSGIKRYEFNTELSGDSFISITLAWDRDVQLAAGAGPTWDAEEKFVDFKTTDDPFSPPADSVINNLRLWLLPAGASTTAEAIAVSDANEGTLQHIFFQLPHSGGFEFWVEQLDDNVSATQDYAIAWWAKSTTLLAQDDFNNDGTIDGGDLTEWKNEFGTGNGADANGDGVTDGADFLVWQQNFGLTSATPTSGAVPEPSACMLIILGLPFFLRRGVARCDT
jgi:hypothetical protein